MRLSRPLDLISQYLPGIPQKAGDPNCPFLFVPRCVPWALFQGYLAHIRSRFRSARIVVLEANEANLKRYDRAIAVLPYRGGRFISAEMARQLEGRVNWALCLGVVVSWSNMDGAGFEELLFFAREFAPIPTHVIKPDLEMELGYSFHGQREELPPPALTQAELAARQRLDGCFEGGYRCPDGKTLLFGWVHDMALVDRSFTVCIDKSSMAVEGAQVRRYPRPDLPGLTEAGRPGFILLLPCAEDCPESIKFGFSSGATFEFDVGDKLMPPQQMLEAALVIHDQCGRARAAATSLRAGALELLGPVLEDAGRRLCSEIQVAEEWVFGSRPIDPKVTLIIPVYGLYELIRHQVASFATDPFLREQEIVFVLSSVDDPALDLGWFKTLWERLFDLYGLPVRVLIPTRECWFSRACNLGALAAGGSNVLLLNSDVFPKSVGWLEEMLSVLDHDESVGIVGARLLYPDGSLQHVGLSWRREEGPGGLFHNTHPLKGMPPSLGSAAAVSEVPAVTGACMLLKRDLFVQSGMMDTAFIRGDFEDSDFCIRIREMGKRVVCAHRAELYHLEGVSSASCARNRLFRVNATLHTRRWETQIERLLRSGAWVPK